MTDMADRPADWKYGGADGKDPAADPRWEQSNYRYRDNNLDVVWTSSVHRSDRTAISYISIVNILLEDSHVAFVEVRRQGSDKFEVLHRVENSIGGVKDEPRKSEEPRPLGKR